MRKTKIIILTALILSLLLFIFNIHNIFSIEEIDIKGNSYYSNEGIKEIILKDNSNSLFLFLKYYINKNEYPFIDDIKITLKSPKYIDVKINEKNILGYINYMGTNLYFDNDGNLIESSSHKIKNIPCIEGVKFDYIELNKKIEVNNSNLFDTLLLLKKSLKKYELTPDRIYVENNGNKISLYFEEVKINIGRGENIDEKVDRIQTILPELKGESGTLYMEGYTNESKNVSFVKNKDN